MKFFILAAGQQTRWGNRGLKQLVTINKKPLIRRTYEQFSKHGTVHIVTIHKDIRRLFPKETIITPEDYRYTITSALSTQDHWDQRSTILLGDVYYTDEAVKTIVQNNDPFKVFGSARHVEIYAISFTDKDGVIEAAEQGVKNADEGGRGKLWEIYKPYSGVQLKVEYPVPIPDFNEYFIRIEDDTQDFDTEEEWLNFKNEKGIVE